MENLFKLGGDIIKGHINELLNDNEDISEKRMAICRKCPLFKDVFGGICNPKLYLNPETDEVSTTKKPGFSNGCGCRMQAKTRLTYATCSLGKW